IDQALSTVGQFAALDVLDSLKSEKPDQFGGFGVQIGKTIGVAPEVEAAGMARLQRQAKVLVDRRGLEQAGDLKRAREAALTDVLDRQALNIASVETDLARV